MTPPTIRPLTQLFRELQVCAGADRGSCEAVTRGQQAFVAVVEVKANAANNAHCRWVECAFCSECLDPGTVCAKALNLT
jgi:hypothetical protein